MATKRKRPSAAAARRAEQKSSLDRRWSLLLFALGVVFVVLAFVKGEAGWYWLHTNLLFGIFGVGGWLVGPLFIYWALVVGYGRPLAPAVWKGLFALAAIAGLVMVFGGIDFTGYSFADATLALFELGRSSRFGAGALSFVLGWTLWAIAGRVVAQILMVLLVLISIMVLSGFFPADIARLLKGEYERHAENRRTRRQAQAEWAAEQMELAPLEEVPTQPARSFHIENPFAKKDVAPPEETTFGDASVANLFGNEAQKLPETPRGETFDPLGVKAAPPKEEEAPALLFGEDDPFAQAPDIDLFGRGSVPEPEGQAAANAHVDALIDKAAAEKPGEKAADSRSSDNTLFAMPYRFPPATLFKDIKDTGNSQEAKEEMRRTADKLISTLSSFGVSTTILDVTRGPAVTRYEIKPQEGVKISRITNLADDIALNLAAAGVRIEAPIPGKAAVGIEVPNAKKGTVAIRSILESAAFAANPTQLSIALGKDISGDCVVADLTRMPHLLIAGATGSGKSVCVNATIMSFLYRFEPEDLKMILIDPKIVELAEYNGIPHLLMPVVTDPRKAAGALSVAVSEMDRRYRLFAENGARDFKAFNKMAAKSRDLDKLPYIVVVVDELADLMMVAGKEVETHICRIAQKARAAGMHLIVATQRPSVDVITGLIKANIPSRIAFAVSSQVDSRTILDGAGAEKLLGMGDMLFMPVGASKPTRVQGTYVRDSEITDVLNFIKKNNEAQYDEGMIEEIERLAAQGEEGGMGGDDNMAADPTLMRAVEVAFEQGQVSTSFLQRRLSIGYAKAGRTMDSMERMGIISQPEGSKPRRLLITRDQWLEMQTNAADREA